MKYLVKKDIEVTNQKGVKTKWNKDSNITELQVTDEQAKELIKEGTLEILEGKFPEVKVS